MTTARFDTAELDKLERHEFHLSVLAAVFVLVLAGGVALLMYPLVFVRTDESNKWTLRFAFLGFCLLSVLFVVYLFDRQRTVRKLKQHLVDELQRNVDLRHQANVDLLHTIPDLSYFQDRLVMECRRASSLQRPLSLLAAKVKLSGYLTTDNDRAAILGEAARAMTRNLRPTDSIYVLAEGIFAVILPEADSASTNSLSQQMDQTLRQVGSPNRFTFEIVSRNFPENVRSARELEEIVNSLLPNKSTWAEVAEHTRS